MDALDEYARHWLHKEPIRLGHPNWTHLNRVWISEVEDGRPGFRAALRLVALEVLSTAAVPERRKAFAVLAIVGTADDCAAIQAAGAVDDLAKDARTAIYEIQHR